jgi:Protein of unknown function (DUF1565)
MGDLYVNATTGMDAPGRGTTLSDPLRTITFAVNEAVTRFGAALSTVHVAAGTYNEALGEEFPVLLPQNISLFGAGSDQTFLRMERDFGSACSGCMQGGREIRDIALVGVPLTAGSCRLTIGILLQQDGTYIHNVAISGFAAGDFGFGHGIAIWGVAATIEGVQVSGCEIAIHASSDAGARSSIRHSRFDVAGIITGDLLGEISDNHFDSCDDVAIRASSVRQPGDASILRNHFHACNRAISCEPDPLPSSTPFFRVTVSRNTIVDAQYAVDILTRGDVIVSDNVFELSHPMSTAIRVGGAARSTYSPILKDNIMSKTVALPAPVILPLVEINDGNAPILEGNSLGIASVEGEPLNDVPTIIIAPSARPNFGGGVGRRRSAGRNRFVTGGIQILSGEDSAPRAISARNNYWRRAPPVVIYAWRALYFIWPGMDVEIDPRGGSATVDVDGAMSL